MRTRLLTATAICLGFMLPLGRLRVAQQMYWVFQYAGWNEEWYEVVRIAPKRTRFVVEFYAGGLRGCGY